MKKEVLIGLIMLLLGTVTGALTNEWTSRAQPQVTVSSINFDKLEDNLEQVIITVPEELREKVRPSAWVDNLEDEISVLELGELINSDISETHHGQTPMPKSRSALDWVFHIPSPLQAPSGFSMGDFTNFRISGR